MTADTEEQKQYFIYRLKARCAQLAIGPSTLRGRGTTGSAAAGRKWLAGSIDPSLLNAHDTSAFESHLDKLTEQLEAALPERARRWGRARKALNIFLRDIVYNIDLCDFYQLRRIRPWLEVPLDSHVAKGLAIENEGPTLPKWPGVMHLDPDTSRMYQNAAAAIAKRHSVHRVDLDVFYWRAGQL